MGQKGRDRSQRRRGFDDEEESGPPAYDGRARQPSRTAPRESAAPSGPAVDAIVKWFNSTKGFGFVELADESGDAFLHAAVLEADGRATVDPDSKLRKRAGRDERERIGAKGRALRVFGQGVVNSVDLTTSAAVAAFYARRGRLHSGRLESPLWVLAV
jgi:cold shock CspA family protein